MVVEPPIEPDELPLPIEPLPVLGELVLGEVLVELEPEPVELPLLMPDEAPVVLLVPPDAPLELPLLNCASHSAREICPSLFLSTSEKLGVEELPDEDELPPLAAELGDEEDEEDGVLDEDEADGVLEDEDGALDLSAELLLVADGAEVEGLLDDEDEDWATASVDSAKSTAAVVTLRVFLIGRSPRGWEAAPALSQALCPDPVCEDQLTVG